MLIKEVDFKDHYMNKLIKGAVVPRPIAWVSTVNSKGGRNLAPFSFFTVASMDPVTLCFSVGEGKREKDTLTNIKETGQFIINIVTERLANAMHESSKSYDAGVDEFIMAEVEAENGETVRVPRVKESPVHMECELDRIITIGAGHLVLGKLVGYHVEEEVYMEGDKVDPEKLRPVGRMGGNYNMVRDFYSLPNSDLPS
ncbi:UNVERIFIED_CONTAM: flavin reductase family protein [Halobacillus marinus]|uniref:flavin reductase family protein n=1 Tax=Bacillaceae TaxID=186817 RepID=UPI000412AD2A|nr:MULTISPECIES: flavin reductase family protein [Bacillaceae]QHT45246.1 flavin reductase family protein [Bacillus sp. SB49]